MITRLFISAVLLIVATLSACAQVIGIEELPDEVCDQGNYDVNAQARGAMLVISICQDCHSEMLSGDDRRGAPETVNFDYSVDIDTWEDRIRARVLEQSPTPMPPSVTSALSIEQISDLRAYLDCRS